MPSTKRIGLLLERFYVAISGAKFGSIVTEGKYIDVNNSMPKW